MLRGVRAGSGLVRKWAGRGEGGGEVDEDLRKWCARVADGESDELHSPPMFLEGRDEGVVFFSLLIVFLVAS